MNFVELNLIKMNDCTGELRSILDKIFVTHFSAKK